MKRHLSISSLLLLSAAIMFAGCDSQSSDENDPPQLMPAEAFSLQTDIFAPSNGKTQAKINFASAALRVWPVSVLLQAHLLIPAVVTAAALEAEPELVDGTWIWATTAEVNARLLTFSLTGDPVDDGVDWSLSISTDGPDGGQDFDEFTLLTGYTSPGGLTGSWQLYYPINGQRRNVLNAEYELRSDDDRELTFSIPETADDHAGDWVRYAVDGSMHSFEWHQSTLSIDHLVVWNADTKEGGILASNHNGGAPACWDAQLEDAPCLEWQTNAF